MRIKQAALRGTAFVASTAILGLCLEGCVKTYLAPALPANQLARVKFDSITRDMEVDGLPLASEKGGKPPSEISVGVGCRVLTVKYEASYFIWGDKKADRAGLGTGLAATLANTEEHDYETMKPIRFFIPEKEKAKEKSWRRPAASTGSPPRSPAMSFCRASSRAMRAAIRCASSYPTSRARARRPHRGKRRSPCRQAPPSSVPQRLET